jgi:hypothetical protein
MTNPALIVIAFSCSIQTGHELTVVEMGVQALLGRHSSYSCEHRIPRTVGKRGSHTLTSRRHSYESSCLFRHRSGLKDQLQTCANRDSNQQLERQAGYPAAHDLADRELRDLQQLGRCRLAQLLPDQEPRYLQGHVPAQGPDGQYITLRFHHECTIRIADCAA